MSMLPEEVAIAEDGAAEFPDDTAISGPGQPDERSIEAIAALLKSNKSLANKIVSRVKSRKELSERHMAQRFPNWIEVDTYANGLVNPDQLAKKGDGNSNTAIKEAPWERPVVIPISAALMDVRRTQLYSLLSRRKIEYEGRGPEDVKPAKLMTAAASYSLDMMGWKRVLWGLIKDIERYGVAIAYDQWDEEPGWVYGPPPIQQLMELAAASGDPALIAKVGMIPQMFPALNEPEKKWGTKKEFVRWINIDPYYYYGDPRVPIWDVQAAEFQGHHTDRSQMYLEERRMERGGPFINVDEAKKAGGRRSGRAREATGKSYNRPMRPTQDAMTAAGSRADDKDAQMHSLDNFQIKILPKEWGLPGGDDPEIWWFTLCDDAVIVRCHPNAYDHGEFTYSVGQADHDPHTLWVPGSAELLLPSQRLINWLGNSHYENARKILNNQFIYDHTLVEEDDLLNPGPMWHIRLSKEGREALAGGRSIESFIHQMQVTDVTKGHFESIRFLIEMLQRQMAANDPAQGVPTDDKRTLGEVQAIMASSNQRLGMAAQVTDEMMLMPLAQRLAQNIQQFMTQEAYFKVTGDLASEGEMDPSGSPLGRILISRPQLMGNFDYTPITSMVPDDPTNSMDFWQQIFQTVLSSGLMQIPRADGRIMDVWKLFEIILTTGGVKNINDLFQAQPAMPGMMPGMSGGPGVQVAPDAAVQQAVQAGNLVPVQ